MKKLFLTICFSLILWQTGDSAAKTMSFQDMEAAQAYKQSQPALPLQPIKDNSPDPRDTKAMEKYIIDRLKNATFSTLDNMNKPSSMNMQHSDEYIAQMKEKNKSFLEKVYDNAINRISSGQAQPRSDARNSGTKYIELKKDDMQQFQAPEFPVVNVELPTGDKTLVPAQEHIPYLSSQIEILPSGLASINDTIVVVAGGKKLKNGLARIIPKISTSREGVANKINVNVVSVSVNEQEIPHKLDRKSVV